MAEFDRLGGSIAWIDLSSVARDRTPEWAIQVGIRYHLTVISLRYANHNLDGLGVDRSHVAIHEWVHKANLQAISTVAADQLSVAEKIIRLHDDEYWLYGAVDPRTNEILHVNLFSTTTKQTTRWFLDELHSRYQLEDVLFLVADANYLGPVFAEDGSRFR